MSHEDIRDAYILYIGAGAVAAGGIISLFQALPLILGSIKSGVHDLSVRRGGRCKRHGPRQRPAAGSSASARRPWSAASMPRRHCTDFAWSPI